MRDLSRYEKAFDRAYPDYTTDRYETIVALTERLAAVGSVTELNSRKFQAFIAWVEPVTQIRNYKSQVPFPVDLKSVLQNAIKLKQCRVPDPPLSGDLERLFLNIVQQEGFQLPTASALFHFCHPKSFPIVDRNVEAACELLKDAHRSDFDGYDAPKLPVATTSANNKLSKYRSFIDFINRVRHLQREQHGGTPDYRFIDKALMVFGVDTLRRQVDDVGEAR